jgi:hypothetical protein
MGRLLHNLLDNQLVNNIKKIMLVRAFECNVIRDFRFIFLLITYVVLDYILIVRILELCLRSSMLSDGLWVIPFLLLRVYRYDFVTL